MSKYQIRPAVLGDEKANFTFIFDLMLNVDAQGQHLYEEKNLLPIIQNYLEQDCGVYIFIATDQHGLAQGVICLNEWRAIYALGTFGEISELYVNADQRSNGLGEILIKYAEEFAKLKNWSQIEVGAPDLPKWQRSVNFYHRCGYKTIGPRLYKWINKPA